MLTKDEVGENQNRGSITHLAMKSHHFVQGEGRT